MGEAEIIPHGAEQALIEIYKPAVQGFLKALRTSEAEPAELVSSTVDDLIERLEQLHSCSFRTAPSNIMIKEVLEQAVDMYEARKETYHSGTAIADVKSEVQKEVKQWKIQYGSFKQIFLRQFKKDLRKFLGSNEVSVEELDDIISSDLSSESDKATAQRSRKKILRSEKKWFEGYVKENLFVDIELADAFNFRQNGVYSTLQQYMIRSHCTGFRGSNGQRFKYWRKKHHYRRMNWTYSEDGIDVNLQRPGRFERYLNEREDLVRKYDDIMASARHDITDFKESTKKHHLAQQKMMEAELVEDLVYERLYGADNTDEVAEKVLGHLVEDTLIVMKQQMKGA